MIKQINKRNNGSDSMLPQQRVQIQSLVRDLRSCKPYGMANKKKGKIIIIIKQDSLSTTVTQKCLRCLRLEHGARMAYISTSADSTRFTSQRRNTSPLLFGISQIAKKKKKSSSQALIGITNSSGYLVLCEINSSSSHPYSTHGTCTGQI